MGPSHTDASVYAWRLAEYSKAIKRVDPSVILIASGLSPEWDRVLLSKAGNAFEILSEHNYAPEGGVHQTQSAVSDADFAKLVRFPQSSVLPMLETTQRIVREAAPPGRKIKTVFDEWNIWHDWFSNPANREWRVGPVDACFVAAMLNMLCRESGRLDLDFAAYFQPVQEGAIRVDSFSAELTPVGQVFTLYQAHQNGRRLNLDVPHGSEIDEFASLSENGKHIHVTLVNRKGERNLTAQLALANAKQVGDATITSLTAADLVPDKPLQRHTTYLSPKGNKFRIPVARYGVVLVEIPLRNSKSQ
jgi:alpha-L-arabinofuranosidase